MLVKRISGPNDSDNREMLNPSFAEIESAIRELNGRDCSLVILGIDDPVPHMGIGGGADGKYVVYHTADNLHFSNLINPDAPKGRCELKAGGQLGDYELRQCCTLSDLLTAATTYAETGQSDPNLVWEE